MAIVPIISSQIAGKLEKKGLLVKEKDFCNQSKLLLKLTSKGETANRYHEYYHQHLDTLIEEVLIDASAENVKFLKLFLDLLKNRLDAFDDDFIK